MRAARSLAWIGLALAAGCREDERPEAREERAPEAEQPVAPGPPPPEPRRVAAEGEDLRIMLAEIASVRACDRLEGSFRGLRTGAAADAPVTGILWVEGCEVTADGTDVAMMLTGRGWRWVERTSEKAGAEFAVAEYVRFAVDVEVRGTLDVAYAPASHIATLWFTPSGTPDVQFRPIGDVTVAEIGAWSEIVGAAADVFGASPAARAEEQVEQQGEQGFEERFAEGLAATVDLCTGAVEVGFGHPEQGQMLTPSIPPDAPTPARVRPGGVLLDGPHPAGSTVHVTGDVRARLLCHDTAAKLAAGFAEDGTIPDVRALVTQEVRGEATLHAEEASCPVVLAVQPLGAPAELAWSVKEPDERKPLASCPDRAARGPDPAAAPPPAARQGAPAAAPPRAGGSGSGSS